MARSVLRRENVVAGKDGVSIKYCSEPSNLKRKREYALLNGGLEFLSFDWIDWIRSLSFLFNKEKFYYRVDVR